MYYTYLFFTLIGVIIAALFFGPYIRNLSNKLKAATGVLYDSETRREDMKASIESLKSARDGLVDENRSYLRQLGERMQEIHELKNANKRYLEENANLVESLRVHEQTLSQIQTENIEMQKAIEAGEIKTVRFEAEEVDGYVVYRDGDVFAEMGIVEPKPVLLGAIVGGNLKAARRLDRLPAKEFMRREKLLKINDTTFVRKADVPALRVLSDY